MTWGARLKGDSKLHQKRTARTAYELGGGEWIEALSDSFTGRGLVEKRGIILIAACSLSMQMDRMATSMASPSTAALTIRNIPVATKIY